MDGIAHILLGIALIGPRWEVVFGSLLPDALYLLSIIKYRFDLDKSRNSRIFIYGERIHSFIFWSIILLPIYVLTGSVEVFYFGASIYLHLLADLVTHRDFGPRFFWPLIDDYFPRGLVQWENKYVFVSIWVIICLLLAVAFY